MSSRENLAVEKLLLKLRHHLWRVSKSKSGNVTRNLTIDGRVYKIKVTGAGSVNVEITLGSTVIYGVWNGRDSLVYGGSERIRDLRGERSAVSKRIDDTVVLLLLRTNIKRAFPDYNKASVAYVKPNTKKGRHRMLFGEVVSY
jgi:hypothetical protein